MKYKINDLASSISYDQAEITYRMQTVLKKYNIEIKSILPVSISFIPWPLEKSPDTNMNIIGNLSWNPFSKIITVQYTLNLPFHRCDYDYSRILKWYLSRWNEEKSRYARQLNVNFTYPGNNGSELILYAFRRTASDNLEKIIKMILVQTHEIIETEIDVITSILEGHPSDLLKTELLNEINILVKELSD